MLCLEFQIVIDNLEKEIKLRLFEKGRLKFRFI